MKRFLTKIVALVAIFVVSIMLIGVIVLSLIAPQYKYGYNASLIDKVERLKNCSSPKIILVGNSNLAFGINSEKIEYEFKMPVVNLSLHGGLGNEFHERIAKDYINSGDILIVCHSSFNDDGKIQDPELAWITLENNFELYGFVNKSNYFNMAMAFPTYCVKSLFLFIRRGGNQKPQDCYSRLCFNEYGDNIFPREYDRKKIPLDQLHPSTPKIGDVCVNRLNQLNEYCKSKGAVMLIAGYPIFKPKDEDVDVQYFKKFKQKLQERLDCEVISDYTDYIYDETLFYNTNLHLTNEGAAIRTAQLIKDLKKYFAK